MGKRGPKPRRIISEKWTPELAYAVGLLATDGCLSYPWNQIDLTSVDREQLENFNRCLGTTFTIGSKTSGKRFGNRRAFRIQFKNVYFYEFLTSIGLTPRKSRTIGPLKIPAKYFWDFLRGVYDGDGSSHAYWDTRWRSSYMFYTIFASVSRSFVDWLRSEVRRRTGVSGHVTSGSVDRVLYQLKYAKKDSLIILRKMYYSKSSVCLSRKRLKLDGILSTVGEKL